MGLLCVSYLMCDGGRRADVLAVFCLCRRPDAAALSPPPGCEKRMLEIFGGMR